MPGEAAFIRALTEFGFDANTRGCFTANGVSNLPTLVQMLPKALTNWISVESKIHRTAAAAVHFPYIPVQKLHAYRAWAMYRHLSGLPELVEGFDEDLQIQWDDQKELIAAEKDQVEDRPVVPKLSSLDDWPEWEEKFISTLGTMRNPKTEFPLSYLLRKESVVPPADLVAVYHTIDDQICALALHEGGAYKRDLARLFDLLKPLIIDGGVWCFIQPLCKKGVPLDGRKAFLTLKRQAEGTSAIASRKNRSYALIRDATWTGKDKGWTFDKYIGVHQLAHNQLFTLEEYISESKKVADFLAGIQGDALATSKTIVLGDPTKNSTFEACQQFLKSAHQVRQGTKDSRGVKRLHQERKGKGKDKSKKKTEAKKKDGPPAVIKTGKYDAADYRALTQEEKDKVYALREKAHANGENVPKPKGKGRSNSAVSFSGDPKKDSSEDSEEEDTFIDHKATATSDAEASTEAEEEESEEEIKKPIPKKAKLTPLEQKRAVDLDNFNAALEQVSLNNKEEAKSAKSAKSVAKSGVSPKWQAEIAKAHKSVAGKAKAQADKPKLDAGNAFGKGAHSGTKAAAKPIKKSLKTKKVSQD
jgi:hypothetical protein